MPAAQSPIRLAEVLDLVVAKVELENEVVRTVAAGQHIVGTSEQDILTVAARKGLVTETSIDDRLAIAARDRLARRPRDVVWPGAAVVTVRLAVDVPP